MGTIDNLLRDTPMPRMVRVREVFRDDALADVAAALHTEIAAPAIAQRIRRGARTAVAVGSRGLADVPWVVHAVVDELKRRGAQPFIVSSMETVELGKLPNGLPVYMDKQSMEADGIVVINRVKPHTSFSGASESGRVKMLSIGLGKQRGAESCHAAGLEHLARNIVDMARVKLEKAPVLFGVATLENASEKISRVAAVPAQSLVERDAELLVEARRNMPSIPFTPLDVLVVDQMGKEFSGTGTDPHITGRASSPCVTVTQQVKRMVVLDLSDKSKGSATGMGPADVCTRRLADKVDYEATYANHLTSTVVWHGKLPMTLPTDQRAIQVAARTCNVADLATLRVVRVPNTLHLEHLAVSEATHDEAARTPGVEVLGDPQRWAFDAEGNLTDLGRWPADGH